MTTGIIELNDAGIRVNAGGDWQLCAESPGVAVVNKQELLLGEDALRQSRLQPVHTNSLFWHRLSTEPLSLPNSRYRHHADLAYSHLLSLHQQIANCTEIIFALPGSFTRQQMSLLLGIVSQCPFDAVGLVDSAVAACAPHARGPSLIHVDLQLHQCVFTSIQADSQVQRTQVDVLPYCGLLALREQWAKVIADQFIDQCRFDPLHSAVAEQSLYDQLPEWLRQYHDNAELFLEIGGKSIKLPRELMASAVQPVYQRIVEKLTQFTAVPDQILLGDRLAAQPGLVDLFTASLDQKVQPLPASAVVKGVQANIEMIRTDADQLGFVQTLPKVGSEMSVPETTSGSQAKKDISTAATHLLVGDKAYPFGATTLYVNLDTQHVTTDPTADNIHCGIRKQGDGIALLPHNGAKLRMNEQPVNDNCLLSRGDRVGLDSTPQVLTLIKVIEGNGS
ncbi:MAG: hypothetical protein WDZ30_01445 [Cellvibrionaceae bacterium]